MSLIRQLQWSKLSKRERILFAATVAALFCVLIAFVLQPRLEERRRLNSQKTTLQQEVSSLSSTLPVLLQRAEAAKTDPSASKSEVDLTDASLSSILDEIGRQARMREVQVVELKPNVPENKEGFEVLPIQLKSRSRFFNLGDYIAALERLPRPIVVARLKIESTQETNPEVLAEMTLHIYKKGGA